MQASVRRVGIIAIALSLLLLSSGGLVGTALAQSGSCNLEGPEDLSECEDPSLNPFEGILQNIYDLAYAFIQYAGFVAVFAGTTLWLTADRNSQRGQTGLWLLIGGLSLIVLFFGYTALFSLAKGVVSGF